MVWIVRYRNPNGDEGEESVEAPNRNVALVEARLKGFSVVDVRPETVAGSRKRERKPCGIGGVLALVVSTAVALAAVYFTWLYLEDDNWRARVDEFVRHERSRVVGRVVKPGRVSVRVAAPDEPSPGDAAK